MGSFEFESRIAVVVEAVARPRGRRAVAAPAVLRPVPAELAAMNVAMTRIAGDRRLLVHAGPEERPGAFADSLLTVAILTPSLGVGPRQRIAGLTGMIVGAYGERACVLAMANGAVALSHFPLELPRVRVRMALPTQTWRGREATHSPSRRGISRCRPSRRDGNHDMAPNARNRRVRSGKRIEGGVPGHVVSGGYKPFLFMALGAVRMAPSELGGMRVGMAGFAPTRDRDELLNTGLCIDGMTLEARHGRMRRAQRIDPRVVGRVEPGGLETRARMALRTADVPALELATVGVLMATLTHLGAPVIGRGIGVRIATVVGPVGGMAFAAGHRGMGLVQRESG